MLTYEYDAADPSRPVTSRTEVNGACKTLPVDEGQGLEHFIQRLDGVVFGNLDLMCKHHGMDF